VIEVELDGRMGNHFFQYAFAYCTAKELGTSFRMRGWYGSNLSSFVELASYPKSKINSHNALGKLTDKWYDLFYNQEVINVENDHDVNWRDNVRYIGYFQTDAFFSKYETELRREFVDRFNEVYGELYANNDILCVHVRRSDYADVKVDYLGGESLVLPNAYYEENIKKMAGPDTVVMFVSDDIRQVEKEFSTGNLNYHFSKEDHFMDFLLLAHANKVLIANSSFSWWAGYLNAVEDKVVIAPKYYLGFRVNKEWPIGVMCDEFNWVNVPLSK